MNPLSRSIVTASAALVLLATPTVDSIASAGVPAESDTCATVRTDAYSLTAFTNLVESGNYTADDAPWVGPEDSTIVNVGLWLHDIATGVEHPTFYTDAFPICTND